MWRVQAKFQTVCARCRGYIKRGAWIVQEGKVWCHSVCPGDVAKRNREVAQRKEPLTYTEIVNGVEVVRTLE
jgi:hypothetical protein